MLFAQRARGSFPTFQIESTSDMRLADTEQVYQVPVKGTFWMAAQELARLLLSLLQIQKLATQRLIENS